MQRLKELVQIATSVIALLEKVYDLSDFHLLEAEDCAHYQSIYTLVDVGFRLSKGETLPLPLSTFNNRQQLEFLTIIATSQRETTDRICEIISVLDSVVPLQNEWLGVENALNVISNEYAAKVATIEKLRKIIDGQKTKAHKREIEPELRTEERPRRRSQHQSRCWGNVPTPEAAISILSRREEDMHGIVSIVDHVHFLTISQETVFQGASF